MKARFKLAVILVALCAGLLVPRALTAAGGSSGPRPLPPAAKALLDRGTYTGDLDLMQPHQVERKSAVLARLAGLALKRQKLPRYRGFRLAANAWTGRGRFLQNLLGTCRRIGRGANRESLPL